jgi:hypothetical protein
MFIHKVINTREGNVPLLLGLVTYCTLAIYSSGLKGRGRRRKIRHTGKVSNEWLVYPGGGPYYSDQYT